MGAEKKRKYYWISELSRVEENLKWFRMTKIIRVTVNKIKVAVFGEISYLPARRQGTKGDISRFPTKVTQSQNVPLQPACTRFLLVAFEVYDSNFLEKISKEAIMHLKHTETLSHCKDK